ncbi:HD-GYP domain-containing protein [Paenibacillus turpanensis]|uniref:HD-GYP domain-containing protein n=1 Tax=Paenibacillus turpanensis TaxID=2689078 RepID=UPI0014091EF5|nr:HD-GYP domain-containing protein [Paenibacillus turpanensis]
MAIVPVSQIKLGDRINEDVVTRLGNVLLQKGKTISQRELDVLRAFMIHSISIQSTVDAAKPLEEEELTSNNVESEKMVLFQKDFDDTVSKMKKMFALADAGAPMPVLEIRTQLETLVTNLDQYNILTFTNKRAALADYLYNNSIMVALSSFMLARWYGLPQKDWTQVAMAGLLHDIGNVRVDPAILNKTSKLMAHELEEMKKHTVIGYNILKSVTGLNEGVKLTALQHHEKEDGTGYPLGLKGDKIHIYAKIVAVADIFHAMTSNRKYKDAQSPYLVLEQLQTESFGKLDPLVVQTFIDKVTSFHNGTVVRLNNDSIGEIVFTDSKHPTRPMVNVEGRIINLASERTMFIQEVIKP